MLDLATDVNGTQVEVVDSLVNEKDDLLAGAWLAIAILRDAGQVAAVMSHQHNRLSLRPIVAGKADACARNPLEQISRATGIDVPGDPLHERSLLVQSQKIPRYLHVPAFSLQVRIMVPVMPPRPSISCACRASTRGTVLAMSGAIAPVASRSANSSRS